MEKDHFEECLDEKWICKRCPSLLGYAMDVDGKTYLRIKIKDQYIDVWEPERIDVKCRKCSFTNSLRQIGSNDGSTEKE